MQRLLAISLFACFVAQAQTPAVPQPARPASPSASAPSQWRRNLTGVLGQPPAKASVHDIERLEQNMLSAAAYCGSLTPTDYEANRELARQMTAYLMTVNTMATDPQTRAAALRASRSVAVFPCAFPTEQPKPQTTAPSAPRQAADPPFVQKAPPLEGVRNADKETAAELVSRYETDAAKAATAWRNAETLRDSLAARGMSLNAQTAASVNRFQLFFEEAAAALREHKWDDARTSLQAVEAETQKVAKAVGN
jgi:hypothetical protein